MVVAREPTLDPADQGPDRFAQLARPALIEALGSLPAVGARARIHVAIGLPEPRPGLSPDVALAMARLIADATGLSTGEGGFTPLPRGNAAGILAMELARERLLAGRSEIVVIGGVDSYLTADTLEWMDEAGMLKSALNRNGFPPGEGAGFCVLATSTVAERLGLPVLGWLTSVASANEPNRIRTDTICVGRGLSDAISGATAQLRRPEELVDDSICDLNGEPYRSEEFTFTVLRTQLAFADFTRFTTPSDCWGDVGAASGPLFTCLAVAAGRRGYARGSRTMIWASSEGGDRAAAVLTVPMRGRA